MADVIPVSALAFEARSSAAAASVVELFTSEGCSSCPPADRWLAGLASKSGLWTSWVPAGFHVLYWDDLGWKDRMATQSGTQRQYGYAHFWGESGVYTPCMVLNGRPWRGWTSSSSVPPVSATPGVLSLTSGDGRSFDAVFEPLNGAGPWTAHFFLLGSGIRSEITAGENSGMNPVHEFVVLDQAEALLAADGRLFRGGALLDIAAVMDVPRLAAAVWVTQGGDWTPVQAAGGWLKGETS